MLTANNGTRDLTESSRFSIWLLLFEKAEADRKVVTATARSYREQSLLI